MRTWTRLAVGALALAMVAAPLTSTAAVPNTVLYDGFLRSTTGGPAADGQYTFGFALYDSSTAKSAFWQQGGVQLQVKSGQFSYVLGSATGLSAGTLSGKKQVWLGLKVGSEAELPRQQLHSTAFAMTAAVANGVSCSGCVSVAAMKFNDNVNLGNFGLKAKSINANTVTAATVQAQTFVGDGSKLTGIKVPSGSCASGKVVNGINPDGTLKCATTAASLPKDGLDEISNGVLKNQFVETFELPATDKGKPIPDNTGVDLVSTIKIPNIGTTESFFKVTVDLQNSDLSTVSVLLLPANDKKVGITLCDPCGKKNEKVLKTAFPSPQAVKSGSLKAWIGKNPAGSWNLKVSDTQFCVAQLGDTNCDVKAVTDGKLNFWSISTQVLSNAKVQVTGDLIVTGKLIHSSVKPQEAYPLFPKGSAPFLYGYLEDRLQRQYQYGKRYAYAYNVPVTNAGLHEATRQILYGDQYGNVYRQKGGGNYGSSTHDDSQQVLVAFIKNTSNANINHKLYFYYSHQASSSNYAGIALNGKAVWNYSTGSTTSSQTNVTVTFPKNQTSVLVLKTGNRYYTSYGNVRWFRGTIGFYNNSLKLPAGLEFDYERYHNWVINKD
ncbi:MAG: hypothetical protein KC502_09485 [Myxococcales bacterium]|nr:hypothetical protein [Myxococcales bacterium]